MGFALFKTAEMITYYKYSQVYDKGKEEIFNELKKFCDAPWVSDSQIKIKIEKYNPKCFKNSKGQFSLYMGDNYFLKMAAACMSNH